MDDEVKSILRKVHEVNFQLLKEIDRVCRKNSIYYFLDSGTLLGAVRHKDFIPWDDDIDILVKREDLDPFIQALKKDLDEKYELVTPDTYNEHFWDFTLRVELKHSQRRKPQEEDLFYNNHQNRICVDIFILDKAGKTNLQRVCHSFLHKTVYGLAMGHRYKIDYSKYSFLNKILAGVLSFIGKRIRFSQIIHWQDIIARKYEKSDSKYRMVSNCELNYIDCLYEQEWYADVVELELHGYMFYCPKEYDKVLTEVYGNYMELPPLDKRVPDHNINELII